MAEWTVGAVAERFAEAAETARRLPPVRVQGYFNLWPAFARREWEAFAAEECDYRPLPPTPAAIERMLETMGWVQWLDMEQRHLVWMRARQCEWGRIGKRFGCDRHTVHRWWKMALQGIADRLNA